VYLILILLVLNVTLSSVNDKSCLTFVLATVYRPPGHHTDLLLEIVLAADKVLIVGEINIQEENKKETFGLVFKVILNILELENTY